jgi:Flp pilus assembly CpaE family ATPase
LRIAHVIQIGTFLKDAEETKNLKRFGTGRYNRLFHWVYLRVEEIADEKWSPRMSPQMPKTLTVLLIEDSPDYAALVQQWLSLRTDIAFVLHWTDSLQGGLYRLKQGGVDVILLDLGLPDSSGAETFGKTKLHAAGVPVILLSGDDSEPLALQLVQEGAQDYLVKGSCNGESLAKAIQYAVVRNASRPAAKAGSAFEQAALVGVMGVKGGVGATTIACNLAVELRRQTERETLLVDLDLDCGMVGFLMNAETEYTVLDAAANLERLDASFWGGLVGHYPGGLEVLRSPSTPGTTAPAMENLHQVLTIAQQLYRWVVVDLGAPSRFSFDLLDKLSEVFLVTSTAVPALYEAKRALDGLRAAGFQGDRIRMIVNQLSNYEDMPEGELQRLFGLPVYARFPPTGQELHEACVQRRLPAKNSVFRQRMADLARKMAKLQTEQPRSRVSRIFSFSEKGSAKKIDNSAKAAARPSPAESH